MSSSTSSPDPTPPSSHGDGFARPTPGFDPEQAKGDFLQGHGQGLWNTADGVDESVEDEIKRKIAELEEAKESPVTHEEKERIANKIRSLREGGWLEGLKFELVGKDAVPIEYFNRLAAEHENTILKVAQMNAKKDAQIRALKKGDGRNQNNELKEKLAQCEQHGGKLENEIQGLREELQREKSKPQGNANADDALSKCNRRVDDLQKQLDSTEANLETARQTLSKRYDELESLRQQRMDGRGREQGLKGDVIKLMAQAKGLTDKLASLEMENRDLRNTAAAKGQLNDEETESLQKHIAELEAARANCKAKVRSLEKEIKDLKELEAGWARCKDKVKSLERENKNLKAALQRDPGDTEGLRRRILELEAELAKRDDTIRALEAQLQQARDALSLGRNGDLLEGPLTELQARCKELRDARDTYRNRWARGVVADNPTLVQFWEAVENTNQEINQLYRGIDRLGHVLGLSDDILDTPAVLDKIITQVTASVLDEQQTPQLTVLNLRNANSTAQIRIETLMRELDRAQLSRSEDEIRVQIRAVDEQEVEDRVTARTQTYRNHRRALLAHIFEAQNEFMALAERSADRDAIEALVDRFLQPTTLPRNIVNQLGQHKCCRINIGNI
ncbi:hypothetical protein F4823DRAFT_621928 [Ustulina deusta]|nr:hypothetical protein F4823DRAFT_621928 [Ustulina deusta]